MSGIGLNPYSLFSAAKPVDAGKPAAGASGIAAEGIADFRTALQQAENTALQTAISGADPHAMIEAFTQAEMMLDTVVTIRDKVVEAYQELLRMPV
jgi:flagellar hook-basal body complex protein FliE